MKLETCADRLIGMLVQAVQNKRKM